MRLTAVVHFIRGMFSFQKLKQPPWRTLVLLLGILGIFAVAYLVWSPGLEVRDGRHDLGTNGLWLQHGWLGDDAWFAENDRDKTVFRDEEKLRALRGKLAEHGIRYVFPHLCPCKDNGMIAPADGAQVERLLDSLTGVEVLPWIGGVKDESALTSSEKWRTGFVASAVKLLAEHPRLAGLHVNIEPMPDGDTDYLVLLEELKAAMPEGTLLSVAAYPPPTRWHPFPEVHWGEAYFREVARRCDQIVPMMYDSGLSWQKPYRKLMADWTKEVMAWSEGKQVLLGLPAYDDAGTGYHDPKVENLGNALMGAHAALEERITGNYAGVAVYSEWEMEEEDWRVLRLEFGKHR